MTESDVRVVLLVRAAETVPASGWTQADATWANEAARRAQGERASFEQWLVARARLALERLSQRDAVFATVLRASGWHAWIGWAALGIAIAAGVLSDAIGPAHRINLLAPPLLGLLAWNLVVYAILVLHHVLPRPGSPAPDPLRRPVVAWLSGLRMRTRQHRRANTGAVVRAYWGDWSSAGRTLYALRIAALLHAGAAALVLGALLSLYARGLALEYRAGWESTFLGAASVHAVLGWVLGPASLLSGIALPGVDQLEQLRFPAGPGENAARWIHLYALTLGVAVVVPRLLLAAVATWRAKSMAAHFPLVRDDAYLRRLEQVFSGNAIDVEVLPYSYQLDEERRRALPAEVERIVAPRVAVRIAETLPAGAEDEIERWIGAPSPAPPTRVVLFALTATPEREHHGAFVRALLERGGRERLFVFVDESGFKRRFGAADLATRITQRRSAWQSLLQEEGVEPHFVDLSAPATTTAAAPAASGLSPASR